MPENVLSREDYDVRFLEFPENRDNLSPEQFIDSKIHSIYPGNNGAYEYTYRLYNQKTAIIVFITKDTGVNFRSKKPFVPVFLLHDLSVKLVDIDILCISNDKVIEKIIFKDNAPVRSMLTDYHDPDFSNSGICTGWLFIDGKESYDFSEVEPGYIYKLPRFSDFHRFKKIRNSRTVSFRSSYILSALLLFLIGGASYRYSVLLDSEVSKRIAVQNQIIQFQSRNAEIEKKILEVRSSIDILSIEGIGNPYNLLIAIYETAGDDLKIRRISIQRNTFSVEAESESPIVISDRLSKNNLFSDVSIQRIQDNDDGFRFSLSGRFNG